MMQFNPYSKHAVQKCVVVSYVPSSTVDKFSNNWIRYVTPARDYIFGSFSFIWISYVTGWSSANHPPACMLQKCALENVVCDLEHWTHDLEHIIRPMETWWWVAVISFITICPCIYEISDKMSPKSPSKTTRALAVTFTFDLLTSKSNQFISVPNCMKF